MEKKFDYKKEYKDLYLPKKKPSLIDVPEMIFIAVDGKGNPNTSQEYKEAMEILYGLSYTIKMSKKDGTKPKDYFDYVVPPLEGLWWFDDESYKGGTIGDKNDFLWTSLIRQPDFVTEEVFIWAKEKLQNKKPELNLSKAKYLKWKEGLCVQIMHIGSYDTEIESINKMNKYIEQEGFVTDINNNRKHHEIYLSDPRRCKIENLKTVIRHPVKKI
ncbi:GyrI-like domain-containing protein [Miniphocaeibacter halophilus]|uniref:GyrI-like domain-containing protein n=1 Tax=Miniphocaeibacter halophilus TaxID=2931922 RepID=A0AC61MRI1_9FIRM|nr:GyrI-like domain-containing protein [Miniphocaeibacter halophilus]QQK08255.1 GyrI-like domain-containing protein [Miniphocaeibacter halophilus]